MERRQNELKLKFFRSLIDAGILVVTKHGRVFNTNTDREIGLGRSGGYNMVSMLDHSDGKIKAIGVHILVWLTFKGMIRKGYEINHIDTKTTNNSLENLEELTASGNMIHAIKNGVSTSSFKRGNTSHLLRKSYGNRFHNGIKKI